MRQIWGEGEVGECFENDKLDWRNPHIGNMSEIVNFLKWAQIWAEGDFVTKVIYCETIVKSDTMNIKLGDMFSEV